MVAVSSPPTGQSDETSSRLNIPADTLQREMEWLLKAVNDAPPAYRNTLAAAIWLLKVQAFRATEGELLADGTYDRFLPQHRAMISELANEGEQVILAAKMSGMISSPSRFTLADLQATLNSLYFTFHGEYGPHNPPKTNAYINDLLNGQKPKD